MKFEDMLARVPGAVSGKELDEMCPVTHDYADGCYIRTIFMPAGTVITSKIHKVCHPYFVMTGKVKVVTEAGSVEITAPYSGITPAGTKRAIYVIEDCYWSTVHMNPSNTRDLDVIEDDIIAKSYEDFKEYQSSSIEANKSGVYAICNSANHKFYIGSTKNVVNRWKAHKSKLNRGIHANKKLQYAWNKYGEESFSFTKFHNVASEDDLIKTEQFWLDMTNPDYNILKIAGRTSGYKHTEEWKKENGKRMIGNTHAKGKGHAQTKESKTKISEGLRRYHAKYHAKEKENTLCLGE